MAVSPGRRRPGGRSGTPPPPPQSIGATLERRRLELRARQLEQVLAVLRRRVRAGAAEPARAGFGRVIGDYGAELAQIRSRLEAGT